MKIEVKGMDKVISRLDKLGLRVKFSAAKALNETAYATMMAERKEIADSFDRPTPIIQRAVRMTNASPDNLSAKVYIPGDEANIDYAAILSPHIKGGGRRLVKASERRLRRFGFMGPDQYVVPGPGAQRDQFGNISGAEMMRILGAVRAYSEAGYNRQVKANGYYFVPRVGVFRRTASFSAGTGKTKHSGASIPVLFFVQRPQYEAERFDFYFTGKTAARKALPAALKKHLRVELKR